MVLHLIRIDLSPDGIFSELHSDSGGLLFQTLEHSYNCVPKIPCGSFQCVRGMHQLEGMSCPFETFEITGVIGHTNLLFHVGNYDSNSAGCVLVGKERQGDMITCSREAFSEFMLMLSGIDSFTLIDS